MGRYQRGGLVFAERREVDVPRLDLVEFGRPGSRPGGQDEEHREFGDARREHDEGPEARAVGPVGVVDGEQKRAGPCPGLDLGEEPFGDGVLGVAETRPRRRAGGTVRRRRAAELRGEGSRRLRADRDGTHLDPERRRMVDDFCEQPGLAEAGSAVDHEAAAAAGPRGLQRTAKERELLIAPDQLPAPRCTRDTPMVAHRAAMPQPAGHVIRARPVGERLRFRQLNP